MLGAGRWRCAFDVWGARGVRLALRLVRQDTRGGRLLAGAHEGRRAKAEPAAPERTHASGPRRRDTEWQPGLTLIGGWTKIVGTVDGSHAAATDL
jgi:hypothetical protein